MLRIFVTGALALSMLTVPSTNAEACLHGMKRNVDRDMQRLVRAEKALRQGRYKRAFNLAQRAHSGAIDLALSKTFWKNRFELGEPVLYGHLTRLRAGRHGLLSISYR